MGDPGTIRVPCDVAAPWTIEATKYSVYFRFGSAVEYVAFDAETARDIADSLKAAAALADIARGLNVREGG